MISRNKVKQLATIKGLNSSSLDTKKRHLEDLQPQEALSNTHKRAMDAIKENVARLENEKQTEHLRSENEIISELKKTTSEYFDSIHQLLNTHIRYFYTAFENYKNLPNNLLNEKTGNSNISHSDEEFKIQMRSFYDKIEKSYPKLQKKCNDSIYILSQLDLFRGQEIMGEIDKLIKPIEKNFIDLGAITKKLLTEIEKTSETGKINEKNLLEQFKNYYEKLNTIFEEIQNLIEKKEAIQKELNEKKEQFIASFTDTLKASNILGRVVIGIHKEGEEDNNDDEALLNINERLLRQGGKKKVPFKDLPMDEQKALIKQNISEDTWNDFVNHKFSNGILKSILG